MADPKGCPSPDSEPVGGTFLTSLAQWHWDPLTWWWGYKVHAYYQARESGAIWEQVQGGNAKLVTDLHTLTCPSPLAAVEFSPPPPPEPISTQLFGKNIQSEIIRATAPQGDLRPLATEPNSKFAVISPNDLCAYIHYQRPSPKNIAEEQEILEIKYANIPEGWTAQPPPCKTYVLVNNAARAQPLAAAWGKTTFWPPIFRQKLQEGYNRKTGLSLNSLFPFWNERWTVYHGNDSQLWLAQTWDVNNPCTEPFTVTAPITSVEPNDIFTESPLAVVEVDRRVAVYYLNRRGQIYRTIKTWGVWDPPVEIRCSDECHPRRGTNLSAVVDVGLIPVNFFPWGQSVTISYQDSHGKIAFCQDYIDFWFPK